MDQIGIQIKATDDASGTFARVGDEALRMQQSIAGAGTASAIAMDKLGISAKQTSFALRQVPMQFTDIVVSLQGGQNPLTVLLQQGGQLKDLFGGIVPAAKALGGYVAGLVGPFTLAAAAVAVLGVAYYQGSKEADAYSKALILTGNAAGTTVGQLQAMAASVSKATGATTGAAAEALAALAGSGTASGAQLEKFAATAIRLERDAGMAVADTVKQFSALAKDPVDASTKLNETTRFLTLRIYEQIKALEDQGRTADAAALATSAYADVMNERASKLQANLGYIEGAWRGVASAAKSAWDFMLNVGRAEGIDLKLERLTGELSAAQQRLTDAKNSDVKQLGLGEYDREVKRLQAEIAGINGVIFAKKLSAEEDAKAAKRVQAKIDFDKRGESFATTAQKQDSTLRKEIEASRTAMEAGSITAKEYADRINAVQASFAKKDSSGRSGLSDAVKDQNERIRIGRQMAIEAGQEVIKSNEAFQKAQAKNAEEITKLMEGYEASVRKTIAASDEEVASAQASFDAHNKLKSTLAEEALARLEIARTITQSAYEDTTVVDAQIANKKKLIAVLKNTEVRDASEKSAKQAADEWKKTADIIENSLTDALLRGFESGKDAATNFRDTLTNMFKTLVLRPIVSAVVNPIAQGVTGSLGLSGAASAAGGGSDLLSAASLFGSGGIGGSLAAGAGWLTGATTFGGSLSAGASLIGTGSVAGLTSGLGVLAGALGPIAIGAALLSSLFGGGGFKSSGSTGAAYGSFDELGNKTTATDQKVLDTYNYREFVAKDKEDAIAALQASYANSAKALGIKTAATSWSYAGNTGAQGENPNFMLGAKVNGGSFSQGETPASEAAISLAASRAVFTALQSSDLPKYLAGVFDNIDAGAQSQDQITAALATAQGFKTLHDTLLALPFAALQDLTYGVASGLVAASGGMEKFAANLATYYDNFYSAEEKKAQTLKNISATLGSAGLEISAETLGQTSRDGFRALVEDAGQTLDASGQKVYAALLSVSGAFASVVPASVSASTAISTTMANLRKEFDTLNVQALTARGDTAGAAAAQRTIDTAGLTFSETIQYDINQVAKGIVAGLQKAAGEKTSLQTELDNLTLTSAQLLIKQRTALEGSNQALFDQVQAATLAKTAADELAAATAAMAQRVSGALASLGDTGQGLQAQLLTAQGDPAGALALTRRNALAKLTEGLSAVDAASVQTAFDYNSALEDQIKTITDAATAAAEAARAQEAAAAAAASAAAQLTAAWQSVTDSIFDEVKRIRGLLDGSSALTLAGAQSQFTIASAQARAGDQEAAKLLPALSQTLLTLAEANATTLVELRRYQGQTAASLDTTGNTLASRYGLSVPSFDVGTNLVPQDMLAMVHRGEAIVPAAYNPANNGTTQGNSELIAEVRALRAEVAALRADGSTTATYAKKTSDTLVRVTRDGNAVVTTAEA